MDGFAQIKAFYSWVFNNPDKVKPTHISLYIFLLNQNNRSMWVEWFKCPYDLAMQGSCIGSKTTYYKCLTELQDFGLIKYKAGINNYKAPLIKLICLYKNEQVTVPLSEPLTGQPSVPLTVPLTDNIYKLITDNFKLSNKQIEEIFVFFNSLEDSEIDNCIKNLERTKKEKSSAKKEKTFKKPNPNEIQKYCDERNNGISGQEFFDFYESKDWMIGKNRMKNWKAAVRTWENTRKKNQNNATGKSNSDNKPTIGRMSQETLERNLQGWG